jgi:hypothetical protein
MTGTTPSAAPVRLQVRVTDGVVLVSVNGVPQINHAVGGSATGLASFVSFHSLARFDNASIGIPARAKAYADWTAAHNWPDSADSGESMDPDGDRRANIREFYHGTNPLAGEALSPFCIETVSSAATSADSTVVVIEGLRNPAASMLPFTIFGSAEATEWKQSRRRVIGKEVDADGRDRIRWSCETPAGAARYFWKPVH